MKKARWVEGIRWFQGVSVLGVVGLVACVPIDGNMNGNANGNVNANENFNANGDDDEISMAFEIQVGDDLDDAARVGTTTGGEAEGFCGGFVPDDANHEMFIDESLGMTIRATGEGAAPTLWVVCGASNFCGEGVATNTVALTRFWNAGGPCEIYVGTAEAGESVDYTLEFVGN